jgi:N-acetylglucosamine-6-phosphate deacetylase
MHSRIRAAASVLADGWRGPTELEVVDGHLAAVRPLADGGLPEWTLVPGFVDLQVNGIGALDVARAEGDDWSRLDTALVAQGVTAWCPTLGSAPLDHYAEALARISAAAGRDGPRPAILGAHLEGPFLGDRHGAHPDACVVPADVDWVASLDPVVRIMTVGPEAAGAIDLVRALVAREAVVALGHTAAEPDVVRSAVDAGASLFTHLFNASGTVGARSPGPVGAALADDRLTVSLIADLVHLDPVTLAVAFRAKPAERVVLVTDAVAWKSGWARDQGIGMVEGAPRLPDGTIAGSALTMDQAVRNLVQVVGLDLAQAVQAASTNPARVMGCVDRGVLVVGARADVVALDADLHVAQVWIAGHPMLD